jgi:hypothetical protein
LNVEAQPLLVLHALDRLPSEDEAYLWLDSLSPRDVRKLADSIELPDTKVELALNRWLKAHS